MTDKKQIDALESAIIEASQVWGSGSVKEYLQGVTNSRFIANELVERLRSLGYGIIELEEDTEFEKFLKEYPAPKPEKGKFPEQVFPDGYQRFLKHKANKPA